MTMAINIPEVVAEVAAVAEAYDRALAINDLDTIDRLFWNSPFTLRYGPNGTLVGHGNLGFSPGPQHQRHRPHTAAAPDHDVWQGLRRHQYGIGSFRRDEPAKPNRGSHA